MKRNETVPADLLLLYVEQHSDNESAIVNIMNSCNLDGENSLKARKQVMEIETIEELQSLEADIEYELPNKNLEHWHGILNSRDT